MSENAKVVQIVSPGEFMELKRQVLVWTVITKEMRENGYKSIKPQFTIPDNLADNDICHLHAVELPMRFDFGDRIIHNYSLYDYEHDQTPVVVSISHDETMLNLQVIYKENGKSHIDTYNYPLTEPNLKS